MLVSGEWSDIDLVVRRLVPELVAFRRDLHRHPELGWAETRTTARIVERLATAGLTPRIMPRGTGVICDVGAGAGKPARVGLRGDIDALPIIDETTGDHRSILDGVCHACGHDVHTSIILGAGLALAELHARGSVVRPVRLIFQPAEERTPGGALEIIEQGELENLERVYAVHCDPRLEVGELGFHEGGITAAATRVRVDLQGPGGHTARPHLGADLVYALGEIVSRLPGILSRRYDPRAALSLVWGQVHAGAVSNAMPQAGFVEGTIRTLDLVAWEALSHDLPEIIEGLLDPLGVKAELDIDNSVPPCVNDAGVISELRNLATEVFGERVVAETDQSMGGEDFAWMLQHRRGALVRLGVRPASHDTAPDLHQGSFDVDEDAIAIGTMFVTAASQAAGWRDDAGEPTGSAGEPDDRVRSRTGIDV